MMNRATHMKNELPAAHLLGAGAASGSPTAQFFVDYFVGNGALDIPHYLIRDEVTQSTKKRFN